MWWRTNAGLELSFGASYPRRVAADQCRQVCIKFGVLTRVSFQLVLPLPNYWVHWRISDHTGRQLRLRINPNRYAASMEA